MNCSLGVREHVVLPQRTKSWLCEGEIYGWPHLGPPRCWTVAFCWILTHMWVPWWCVSPAHTLSTGLVLFILGIMQGATKSHFVVDKMEAQGDKTAPKQSRANSSTLPRGWHNLVYLPGSVFHYQWEGAQHTGPQAGSLACLGISNLRCHLPGLYNQGWAFSPH